MNTMTLIDDYLDALLDGGASLDDGTRFDGAPFDGTRLDGMPFDGRPADGGGHGDLAADRQPRAGGAHASPPPERDAPAIVSRAEIPRVQAQAVPGAAADPLPVPLSAPLPEPMRATPAAPPPAFVPAFVAAVPAAVVALADTAPSAAPQPSSTPALATSHRWLRVTVGRDSYALELLRVQEVVRLAPIVALRGAARAVLGVMNLRGRIVPVVDLGLWLDAGCVLGDERSRIVVVERADEMIGVLVSAVEDVVTLGRERIEPPLASSDPGAIVGIARVGAAPTVLLDAGALFG